MPKRVWIRRSVMSVFVLALSACTSVLVTRGNVNPLFSEVIVAGRIQNERIIEASGLARSNHHNELLWTMNDEGPPALYTIGTNGSEYGSVTILNASNIDWEDLATPYSRCYPDVQSRCCRPCTGFSSAYAADSKPLAG